MGFKIKNSLTGEFEKLPILTLKGEKGETGGVEEYNKVDYMGNKYETLKQANDANVEYAVKTAIGEFNYLDYEGQHITATNSIEGQAKSAILKGNTLVNCIKIKSYATTTWPIINLENVLVQPNKKYIAILKHLPVDCQWAITNIGESQATHVPYNKAMYSIFTSPSTTTVTLTLHINKGTQTDLTLEELKKVQPMIIEYQDGMENWDIPYFEGMASVKAPVLKSVGKNLFDGVSYIDGFIAEGNNFTVSPDKDVSSILVKVNKNTDYILSAKTKFSRSIVGGSLTPISIGTKTTNLNSERVGNTIKFNSGIYTYIIIYLNETKIDIEDIQVEEGSVATPFEPYKSNSLTANEDVVLRGIGDVKDTLDVNTGKLTQRFLEYVFDGTQHISRGSKTTDTIFEAILNFDNSAPRKNFNSSNGLSDKLPIVNAHVDTMDYIRFNTGTGDYVIFGILSSKLETNDINGVRKYLKQNPITVQYELATPVVKTVDLSDNHVYSYKNITHYDCSSAEGSLVPTLSVKVPTDVQATIAQQRETIQTLNSENERLNQIQEALKASMLDSQVQLMNLSWNTDFEVFTLRESIAPKDFLLASRTGSNIDKFNQAKFIIENDCPDLEKLNSQIEYYFSKDVFSQEQFEELTDLISIVKGGNGCEY